jgi:glycosyltransferase involved in cell wall biosynthesis
MVAQRPLLTLCMIVKDEAATIERTLASVKPFVDRWLIVDTGSTDATREVVARAMAGVPGDLRESPFVDFATTRNVSLDLAGDATEFLMWLDADDELVGGDKLRAFLHKNRDASGIENEAYYVRVETAIRFDSARVARTRAGWRFKGVVHEVLMHPNRPPPRIRVPDVLIRHAPAADAAERSRKRWERDVGLLSRAVASDARDTRSAFYLAQTLAWLDRRAEAAEVYHRRISMGGWFEEVYQSWMQLAGIALSNGRPWREVQELYLEAYKVAPHRAEPLHAIAFHYNATKEHALCLLFARAGYELPLPTQDRLFVDEEVYTWKLADLVGSSAFWVGDLALGEAAARKALAHRPDDARLKANVDHYVERKKRDKARRR